MTSATYTSAIMNILPSVTCIIAWILRMEKVNITERRSEAKIIGTLVSLGGALVLTLYKGPLIPLPWSNHTMNHHTSICSQDHNNWVVGTLLILLACVSLSGFYVLQSIPIKTYPATLICLAGAIQGFVVALVVEGHLNGWAVGWDARLFAPLSAGIVSFEIMYYVQGMVMKKREPVFVTACNPLCVVLVVFLASFILHEQLHFRCLIGGVVIAMGLYMVVWGKGKDYEESGSGSGLAVLEMNNNSLQELPVTTQVDDDENLVISDGSNVTSPSRVHCNNS